jgi:hypothetical protein
MEDGRAPAPAAANGGSEEKMVMNGGGEDDLPPVPALPSGPRKTGLILFIMNIRCMRLSFVRSTFHHACAGDSDWFGCKTGCRSVFKLDELGSEVLRIAVPASLALAADPLASLVDTAFIGRLGNNLSCTPV